jgi:hypothetical protein
MGSDLSGSFDSPEHPRSKALGRVCSTSERYRETGRSPKTGGLEPERPGAKESWRRMCRDRATNRRSFRCSILPARQGARGAPSRRRDTLCREGVCSLLRGSAGRPQKPGGRSDYSEKIRPYNHRKTAVVQRENPYFAGVAAGFGMPAAVGTTVCRLVPTKQRFSASFRAAAILSRDALASVPSRKSPPFSPGMFL